LYQSQASIEVQGINENFLDLRDIYPTAPASSIDWAANVQTQAEILQQDALIGEVVRKLRLDERPEFTDRLTLWTKLGRLTSPGTSAEEAAVEGVKKSIKIVPSHGARIIRIVAEARDPQLAADMANTLARIFIEQSMEKRRRAAGQTRELLSLQLAELGRQLRQSEAALGAQRPAPGAGLGWDAQRRTDLAASRRFYEAMAQRVYEAEIASVIPQPNIHIIGPAQPPTRPYKPNIPLNLSIAAFGGLALGIGWVMLREQTNSVLCAPGEAGLFLTLPELGAIPAVANRGLLAHYFPGSKHGELSIERATFDQRFSGLSESFRTTLASIIAPSVDGTHPHVLVVTSSLPMEGKTTVVSNLGIALAEISNKVLLIDGDLRRPRLHKVFDQANSWGLSDILRETNAIEDLPLDVLVKKTGVPHLYMLPSGAYTDNIFGLLCSARMARLLPRFRQEFDYVLVDAPPCLEFADARIMGRHAEKLLLVVRANSTGKLAARAAVQRLLLDGIPVMGVILNCCDPARADIYGYSVYNSSHREGLA
jgi:receptor protein-tyrosine kinase